MKTVEQAAREYAEKKDKANAMRVMEDFKAGVEFAQRWISVNEEEIENTRVGDNKQVIINIEKLVDSIHLTTRPCGSDSRQQQHLENKEIHSICNLLLETFLQCLQNALNSPEMKDALGRDIVFEKLLRCKQCGAELI